MPGRRFGDGLHQSLEAKENLTINAENQTLASITYQNFFKLYKKIAHSESVIKNNLYSAAVEEKINPETIIEFARIFGFEIDFQRPLHECGEVFF